MQDFQTRQLAAIIVIAVIVGCIPALQPLLLGGLLAEGRLSAPQLGQAASLESLGMAIAVTAAGAFFPVHRLRPIVASAAIGAVIANGLTYGGAGSTILVARFVSGACSGVLLWLLLGMLARAGNATRLFAIYVTLSATGSFVLATALAASGASSALGYGMIAALDAVILLLTLAVPRSYSTLANAKGIVAPTGMGLAGLLVAALNLGGVMAIWVYLVPLAGDLGYHPGTAKAAVSTAIGAQVVAGLLATLLGARVPAWAAISAGAGASVIAPVLFVLGTHDVLLYVVSAVISFCWMFTPPFHLPLVLGLDPSRRSAIFIGSAQLGGMFTGSALASLVVRGGHFTNALIVAGALNVACCCAILLLRMSGRLTAR